MGLRVVAVPRLVEAFAPRTGQYYARVSSGCATSSYYTLYLGAGQCVDDAYEENDSMRNPAAVTRRIADLTEFDGADSAYFGDGGGNPVPEPSTLLLLGSSFAVLGVLRRKKRANPSGVQSPE